VRYQIEIKLTKGVRLLVGYLVMLPTAVWVVEACCLTTAGGIPHFPLKLFLAKQCVPEVRKTGIHEGATVCSQKQLLLSGATVCKTSSSS